MTKEEKESKEKEGDPRHSHHHAHHHHHHGSCGEGTCSCSQKEEEATSHLKEAAEYKDKYLRALAEIENSRRRLTKEKLESQAFAIQEVIIQFLEPLDHMESALQHAAKLTGEVAVWAKGFEMLLQQFHNVLTSYDVIPYVSLGAPFDPYLHEAIEVEERSDVPEGTILFEFKRGYKMGQKTIRPAKVRVSQKPVLQEQPKDAKEEIQENKE